MNGEFVERYAVLMFHSHECPEGQRSGGLSALSGERETFASHVAHWNVTALISGSVKTILRSDFMQTDCTLPWCRKLYA